MKDIQHEIQKAKRHLYLSIAESKHLDAVKFMKEVNYIDPQRVLTLKLLFEKCKEFGIYKEVEVIFK